MIYIELKDILRVIDQDTLNDVIDSDNSFLDNEEHIALEEVSDYLNVRYDAKVELAKTGADRHFVLVEKVVDIMLYNLHSRISPDHIPDLRKTRYKDALTWLEKMASGYTNPDIAIKPNKPSTPLRYGSSAPKGNSYF